jgi:hypothetical protein
MQGGQKMNIEQQSSASSTIGEGSLIVHVTTARGAIPLEAAQVQVRQYEGEEVSGRGDVIVSAITGRDGNTPRIPLPAPARSESLKPNGGGIPPFTSYIVEVFLEGYYTQSYINVPIFDGITAIQPADMIPLSENNKTDSRTPDGERFYESSAPDL